MQNNNRTTHSWVIKAPKKTRTPLKKIMSHFITQQLQGRLMRKLKRLPFVRSTDEFLIRANNDLVFIYE